MKKGHKLEGTIYLNHGRYWWKVRLPGSFKISQISLKSRGSKFATSDLKTAEALASEIWQEHLRKRSAQKWDGKLTTLIMLYNQRNKNYYLPPSNEAKEIEIAIMPFGFFNQDKMADDVTPLDVKTFRQYCIECGKYRWCRKTVNRKIGIIVRMFKWAVSECLVSIQTYNALTTIEGLRKGRTTVREGRKVLPADINTVNATLPFMSSTVSDMVRLQLLTGMRPGEACIMRPCDIDRQDSVWIYQPQKHKTENYGHERIIPLGTKSQEILTKYLLRPPDDFCFKPEESAEQGRKKRHKARKTPLVCGNRPGTHRKGTQHYNDHFDTTSYRHHVQRACKRAGMPLWFPHQLRHTAATTVRREFGLDTARAVLGHKSVVVTNTYAELDLQKAVTVAQKMG